MRRVISKQLRELALNMYGPSYAKGKITTKGSAFSLWRALKRYYRTPAGKRRILAGKPPSARELAIFDGRMKADA